MFSQNNDEKKLDWMYKGPTSLVDREDYLLGRSVDKTLEQINTAEKQKQAGITQPKNHVEHECIPPSIRDYKLQVGEQVDLAAKLQEDPLVAIKKREEETRRQFLQNPVQLKKLQKALRSQEKKKKSKKRKKSKSGSDDNLDIKLAKKLELLKNNAFWINLPSAPEKKKTDIDSALIHKFNKLKNKLTMQDIKEILQGNETSSDSSDSSNDSSVDFTAIKKSKQKFTKKKHRAKSNSSDEDSNESRSERKSKLKSKSKLRHSSKERKHHKDKDKKTKNLKYIKTRKLPENEKKIKLSDKRNTHSEEENCDYKRRTFEASISRDGNDKEESIKRNYGYEKSCSSSLPKKQHISRSESRDDKRRELRNESSDKSKYRKFESGNTDTRCKFSEKQKEKYVEHKSGPSKNPNKSESNEKFNRKKKSEQASRNTHKRNKRICNSTDSSSSNENKKTSKKQPFSKTRHSSSSSDEGTSSSDESDAVSKKKQNWGLVKADGTHIPLSRQKSPEKHTTSKLPRDLSPKVKEKCKPPRLTDEEKKQKLLEMIQNATVRDKERAKNLKIHRENEHREFKQQADFDPDFLKKQLLKSANMSSVESRIKSNINNLQRSRNDMNKHFSKRH